MDLFLIVNKNFEETSSLYFEGALLTKNFDKAEEKPEDEH